MRLNYNLKYTAAWIVAAAGVIAGILAGASQTPWHPGWLTSDVAATAGLIAAACAGLAAFLPQVSRSPSVRESAYLSASVGVLPDDLAAKHPSVGATPTVPPSA